jgi:hypothetical protein
MAPFEELQQLWQSQTQPDAQAAVAAESRGMAAALRRFRLRQYVINGIRLAVIVCVACFQLWRLRASTLTTLGVGVFVAGGISAIVIDWRIQSAIARLDFTCPSLGFVDASLERLRDPNAPFRRIGWICIGLVAVGVNLMFLGPSATHTVASRIASHTAMTLILVAVFALGLKVRAKRYAMEYKPLVQRLAAMKAALEERAQ